MPRTHDIHHLERLEEMSPTELGEVLIYELRSSKYKPETSYIKHIINLGADVNVENKYLETPLNLAIQHGHIEAVPLLIAAGADLEFKYHNGFIPLHFATFDNNIKIVKLLIAAGAPLDAGDSSNNTALYYAAKYDCDGVLKLLLASGASKEAKNNRGQTPWDVANYDIQRDIPELDPNYRG